MKFVDFGSQGLEIRGLGSGGATAAPLTLPDGDAHVVCIKLAAGGVLGRHPASVDQLFAVVEGMGGFAARTVSRSRSLEAPLCTGAPARSTSPAATAG